ncbi:ATP-binding protein [Amycolatopsis albispora]|uniref:ATP-binding protein n=1 Tax=Amycolatopsis albispora TaxID=1804986 RepID=UPI001F18F463|nr:ATP-binding protein [Amycolatopsis albispora]
MPVTVVGDEGSTVNAQAAQIDDIRLVALPSAVSCSAMFVRFTLGEWSLDPLIDQAEELVAQLVTASVEGAAPDTPGFVLVRLQVRGDCLVIEVEDGQPPETAPELDGDHAGVEPLRGGGKRIWCELPLPIGITAGAVALPRRDVRRSVVPEPLMTGEPIGADADFLGRILTGLTRTDA